MNLRKKCTLDLAAEHDLNFAQSVLFNVGSRGLHRKQFPQNISDDHKPLSQAVAISTKLGK